jgi:hypothetical protein
MSKESFSKELLLATITLLDPIIIPVAGIVWEAGKLIYENKNPLKKNFESFLIFVNNHQDEILKKIDADSSVQIGLALLFEQIIKNRVEWKKDRLFGSFLGFIRSEDKEHFELERIFTTISNIDIKSFNSLYEAIKIKKIGYDYIIEEKEIEHMRPPVLSYEKDTKKNMVIILKLNQ